MTTASWTMLCGLLTMAAFPLGAQGGVALDEIEGVAALDDRFVVVTAPRTPAVLKVDMERGTFTTIGRSGEGPGEYRWPIQPVVLRDGRVAVLDIRGSSVVSWKADGTGGARRVVTPLSRPRLDARSMLHGEATQFIANRTTVDAGRDTMALVRVAAGASRSDTIGRLTLVRRVVVGPFQGILPDFATDDLWGVTADGTVWIARARTNHVDRLAPGSTRWTSSPARAWTPVRSTASERRALQVRASVKPPGFDAMKQPMAEVKAPFTDAIADRNGDVWLRLQPAVGEKASRYAVFPANRGRASGVASLPAGRIVVAFSNGFIFVKHETEDGEWVLERVARSAAPIRPDR